MSSHTSNDPMAKFALIAGSALLALTVLILLNFLRNTINDNTTEGDMDVQTMVANNIAMIEKNIKPIGEVVTGDATATAAGGARSGEEVYTAVCAACHATGAANAPKLDDKANWEPRVAQGFDALMNSAINGKGAMPPRAGQNVEDSELKSAIIYMTKEAGFDLGVAEDAPAEAAATEDTATATETNATTEATANTAEQAATPVTETPTSADTGSEADAATPSSEGDAATAPSAPVPAEKPAAPSAPDAATKPAAPAHASIDGEAIYKQSCFACHEMGVAGAPKIGDKGLWEARIATGVDALYTSAIKGKQSPTGVMPAKGGNMSLSDDEVKAAVDYMISKAQ